MKKRNGKITGILLAAVLAAASLSACGREGGAVQTEVQSTAEAQSAAETQDAAAGAAAEQASDEAQAAETQEAVQDASEGTDLLDTVLERGTLIIGTEGTYSPNSYHDESGELVGFDVEVAEGIAEHIGVEAQFMEAE